MKYIPEEKKECRELKKNDNCKSCLLKENPVCFEEQEIRYREFLKIGLSNTN